MALPLLAIPATAQGTVTIGSSLQHPANASTGGCVGGTCTLAIGSLDADRQAAYGVASPVNGMVTTWRISAGITPGPAALRIVRPLAGGLYISPGATPQMMPAANSISTYSAQLPIQRGDLIGVDCCGAGGSTFFTQTSSPQTSRLDFEPGPLGEGPGTAPAGSDTFEVLINADIDPTSAFTVSKPKVKKGAISLTAQVPNSGTIVAGDPRDYALGAVGNKTLMLKYKNGVAAGPGAVSLTVRTTQAARALLRQRGHLKVPMKVLFTPTGGLPASQTLKVKLRG